MGFLDGLKGKSKKTNAEKSEPTVKYIDRPRKFTPITAEEFAQRVMGGERDFTYTRMDRDNSDLSGLDCYQELQNYLREHENEFSGNGMKVNPIWIGGSQWRRVKAEGLYAPYLHAVDVDLRGADLRGANLTGAWLSYSELGGADLRGATVDVAYVWGTSFVGADMRGIKHLKSTRGLPTSIFYKTIVTPAKQEIIQKALKDQFRTFGEDDEIPPSSHPMTEPEMLVCSGQSPVNIRRRLIPE